MSIKRSSLAVLLIFCSTFLEGHELKKVLDLSGPWKFTIGDRIEWAHPNTDVSNWETIMVPGAWEDQGFNGYNGHAWYRTSFHGEQIKNLNDLYLDLGYIDDVDEVYINGQLVGLSGEFPPNFSTAYNARRIYYVPHYYFNPRGRNTIAIRVYDVIHGGGIISGDIGIYTPERPVSGLVLEGLWKFKMGDDSGWKDPEYDDGWWGNKMVPAYWWAKHKGIADYYENRRGELEHGWYRREFELPPKYRGKEMTLIMGKIDDFDKVYVNGHLIGSTRDDKPYGYSSSYRQTRVYEVPTQYLNNRGDNVIAVRVTDMGGEAGIYSGPIGLIETSEVEDFLRQWGG